MAVLAALLSLAAGTAAAADDVDALARLWSGSHDSNEEVATSLDNGNLPSTEGATQRVRTIVAPVEVPWLGSHVLYLEEFLHDEPDDPRRQLLVKLEPDEPPAHGVRARFFTFVDPRKWGHLELRSQRIADLASKDVRASAGCDLVFTREGDQFRGSTVGHRCVDSRGDKGRYLQYDLVIGDNLYWYRRRAFRRSDGDLQEDVLGFNWFELNEARLFSCRIDWSPSGSPRDLHRLLTLDLQDKGGRGHFITPDGRKFELTLHSQDWPFAAEQDSLVLLVQEQTHSEEDSVPLVSAWAMVEEDDISLNLGWLRVRCGSIVPDTDEVSG